jgi:hypothetical protein
MNSTRTTPEAIASLLRDRVPEGRLYEYKQILPSSSDRDVKEFLADVSSFANSSGGTLLFGIREEGGIPVELSGLKVHDIDAEVLRLDALIRDGVEPRIPGIHIVPIHLESRLIFALEVPRSWALPHAVVARGHWRFYARNSGGKYPLDVGELRGAFEFSASARERISGIRAARLGAISAGETPVPVEATGKTVLHIIPLNSLDPGFSVDPNDIARRSNLLRPIASPGGNWRYSLEGFLTFNNLYQQATAMCYSLVMRDGVLEALDSGLLSPYHDTLSVPSGAYEHKILEVLPGYLELLQSVGVTAPVTILLSLIDVHGYIMAYDHFMFRQPRSPLGRNEVLLPGVTLSDFDLPIEQAVRPIFDALWNTFGFERSFNYDEHGNWTGRLS